MIPTQLTVLTNASSDLFKISPCFRSIIAVPFNLIVPRTLNAHRRAVGCLAQCQAGSFESLVVQYSDFFNQQPGEGFVNEELSLFAFLDEHISEVPCPDRCPI